REHEVAPRLAHDAVAVTRTRGGVAVGRRRAHGHLDASLGPLARDAGGVELGAPRLGVVEVAPREHVHPAQADVGGDLGQRGERGGRSGLGRHDRRRYRARSMAASIATAASTTIATSAGMRKRVAPYAYRAVAVARAGIASSGTSSTRRRRSRTTPPAARAART